MTLVMDDLSVNVGDFRSDGDHHWLADGILVKLFGLAAANHLNGEVAEVIGFDNELRRYRVRLMSNGIVKKVDKRNLQLLVPTAPQLGPLARAVGELGPSRETVIESIQRVCQDVAVLQQRCNARELGETVDDMSNAFLKLNTSLETCEELKHAFDGVHGADSALTEQCKEASRRYEECATVYCTLRSWAEMANDEWNITKLSVQKRGLVDTLKNEVVVAGTGLRQDVADLRVAADTVIPIVERVPRIARQATGTVADTVRHVSSVAGVDIQRRRQAAGNALAEQIIAPIRRTWHLFVTAFLLCFMVPLFGLRDFAPLNSLVSNLGIVYGLACITFPPAWANRRSGKAGLLLLWPLVTVAGPLGVQYWLAHPRVANRVVNPAALNPSHQQHIWRMDGSRAAMPSDNSLQDIACRNGRACDRPPQKVVLRRASTGGRDAAGDGMASREQSSVTTNWLDRILHALLFPLRTVFGALYWKLHSWIGRPDQTTAFAFRLALLHRVEPLERSANRIVRVPSSLRGTSFSPVEF